MQYYWKISDDRIWGSDEAAFVSVVPSGFTIVPLVQAGVPSGIDYLRDTLRLYGFELGELKTRLDIIRDIQAEYAPQLALLQEAKAGAEMRDDATSIAEIKAEYNFLLQEMNKKIQDVPND